MSLYNSFMPLLRLLKITFVGVGDFTVGLFLAMVLDQAFTQLVRSEVLGLPPNTDGVDEQAFVKEYGVDLALDTRHVRGDVHQIPLKGGGSIQNPLSAPLPVYDAAQMKVVGLVTLAQLVTTLIVGLELRNFFIPYENFLDPTGGIVFVIALLTQPHLWIRATALIQNVYRAIWWLEQPKPDPPKQS